ncbi:methylthioribose kinase-like isoform X1 [Octopus bimaculoides]|nr:methylthioribose kinase-like isoform X1 [Octopus bimaculoides]
MASSGCHPCVDLLNKDELLETLQRPEYDSVWNSDFKGAKGTDIVLNLVNDGQFSSLYELYNKASVDKHPSIIVKHIKSIPMGSTLSTVPVTLSYERQVLQKLDEFNLNNKSLRMYLHVPDKAFAFLEKFPLQHSLGERLKNKDFSLDLAAAIVDSLATIHKATHLQYNKTEYLEDLEAQLQTHHRQDIMEQLTFVAPYQKNNRLIEKDETLKRVNEKPIVSTAVKDMKNVFHFTKECLIHGNLQLDSIYFTSSNNAYLTNFEFSHIGPVSYDMACLLVNYITFFYYHLEHFDQPDISSQFSQCLIEFMKISGLKYSELMKLKSDQKFWSEVAGFTGCEIIKRLLEPFHLKTLQGCQHARKDMLEVGFRLLYAYKNISSIDSLLIIAFMLVY